MTIIKRRHTGRFATISNEVADDPRLTFEAKGLLVYLLAKPHNWQVRMSDIRRMGGIGRDKAQRLMGELIDAGYVLRERGRGPDGTFVWEYIVLDAAEAPPASPSPENPVMDEASPLPEKPSTVQPSTGEPSPENPVIYKDGLHKNESKKTDLQISPQPPVPGGFPDFFEKLVLGWPADKIGKRDVAEREFEKLPPDKQKRAVDCASTFVRNSVRRSEKVPRLSVYLASQLFELVYGAPEVQPDGYYLIDSSRAEWRPWISHLRGKHEPHTVDEVEKRGWIKTKTRWPEGQLALT